MAELNFINWKSVTSSQPINGNRCEVDIIYPMDIYFYFSGLQQTSSTEVMLFESTIRDFDAKIEDISSQTGLKIYTSGWLQVILNRSSSNADKYKIKITPNNYLKKRL